MGTLKGFPNPPAMSSARRSRAALDAIVIGSRPRYRVGATLSGRGHGAVDGVGGAVEVEVVLVVGVERRRQDHREDLLVVEPPGETAQELRGGRRGRLVGGHPVALHLDAA